MRSADFLCAQADGYGAVMKLSPLLVSRVVAVTAFAMCGWMMNAPQAAAITYPDSGLVASSTAPWVVSMWTTDANFDRESNGFVCTGSLIDKYTVITAAHCIDATADGNPFVIIRAQKNKLARGEVLMPRAVHIHPRYSRTSLANDIAIIDLYLPATSTSYLKIPTASQAAKMLKSKPILYGWGELQNAAASSYLRHAVQSDFTTAATKSVSHFNKLKQLAAGRRNLDGTFTSACYGDSGGPLSGSLFSSKFLLGVVSYGLSSGCATSKPAVFTRVSAYSNWIKSERAVLKADRIDKKVNTGRARFENSAATPIVGFDGSYEDGTAWRSFTARFLTEYFAHSQSDIHGLRAITNQSGVAYWETEFNILPKTPWTSNRCGLGAAYDSAKSIPAQVRIAIRSAASWKVGLMFTYQAAQGSCVSATGEDLAIQVNGGASIPAGCQANIFYNDNGSFSVVMQRACLPNAAKVYVRTDVTSFGGADVEPGIDLWAGPFNLSDPSPN